MVARPRTLEDEVVGLAADVRDLRAVREPLEAIRAMTDETDSLVVAFRDRHPLEGDGPGASPGDSDGGGHPGPA